jgi:Sec-independent protein translocase protein TatA
MAVGSTWKFHAETVNAEIRSAMIRRALTSVVPNISPFSRGRGQLPRELSRNMGLDNPLHIAVLALVLVFVFRAGRLPELARALRAAVQGFTQSLRGEKAAHLNERAPRPIVVEQRAPTATAVGHQPAAYILVPVAEPAPTHPDHVPDVDHRLR